jgi:hypothetical protein
VPRYNFVEITDDLAELYAVKDFERYVLDNTIEVPQDQGSDAREFLNFNYKDAPPYIQQQIEKMYGFQPDPTHAQGFVTHAAEHGARQAVAMTSNHELANGGAINGTGQ